jgi:hypothetical protein
MTRRATTTRPSLVPDEGTVWRFVGDKAHKVKVTIHEGSQKMTLKVV